jgi:hypothetical protein
VAADDDRNGDFSFGFPKTTGSPNVVPAVSGLALNVQVSDARTVNQLTGPFYNGVWSAGEGFGAGIDAFGGASCGAPGYTVFGADITARGTYFALPVPGEGHAGDTNTSAKSWRIPGWLLSWNA